ncbi:hypothetical protein M565_ctg1P1296 [Vibrio cyclitrophicus FF75]|nr:hypothetical protein M565_ctg1P1296 [Vibrio cyclitrophicus FF75]
MCVSDLLTKWGLLQHYYEYTLIASIESRGYSVVDLGLLLKNSESRYV